MLMMLIRHDPILSKSGASTKPGVPLCLSSSLDPGVGGLVDASFVGEHDPPDARCNASFQTALGFLASLAFRDLLVEVLSPGAVGHADLGDCDKVESRVQLTVT